VDSDLAESISALEQAFEKAGQRPKLGHASPESLDRLKEKLRVPRRYRTFLKACDPIDVEVATPIERVCLIAAGDLEREQSGYALNGKGDLISAPTESGWRPEWIIIGHSGLLGDPYFLRLDLRHFPSHPRHQPRCRSRFRHRRLRRRQRARVSGSRGAADPRV
jgi:hypothetical protein